MGQEQLHKRLSDEQIRTIVESYRKKEIPIGVALESLGVKRARLFQLINKMEEEKDGFSVRYQRSKATHAINPAAEKKILSELEKEKQLIENKNIPVRSYNYSFIRDTLLEKHAIKVSVPTVINRAKANGYYLAQKPRKVHDRIVLTNFVGELIQHDSSHHQFSPYISKKLYLITSLDDHSRLLLFANLFEAETTWHHISTLKSVFLQYGCPLKYYVDQHSIFRFVRGRDNHSPWQNFSKFTDDVNPQFKQVLKSCNTGLTYALSPQAKGKIERPYRWIQDRLVRIAAREKIDNISELRAVLQKLVHTYNTEWVHSTTKEIPIVRFENALNSQYCLFKPLKLVNGREINDIFCLIAKRFVNPYRKISLDGLEISVPKSNPRDEVEIRIVPEIEKDYTELRFWKKDEFLGSQKIGLNDLKIVHF